MSAPDTNIEGQEAAHKPSLLGIKGAMLFGAAMMVLVVGFTMVNANDPGADAGLNPVDGAAASTATTVTD